MQWLPWVSLGVSLACLIAAGWLVRRWERDMDVFWRGYDD